MNKTSVYALYAVLAGFSLGCGPAHRPVSIDPLLEPYMQSWTVSQDVEPINVSAIFGPLPDRVVGLCETWSNGDAVITIDRATWDNTTDNGREELIFHELGHCVLSLDHRNESVIMPVDYEVYGSIMNMYWFGEEYSYELFKAGYKQALKENRALAAGDAP